MFINIYFISNDLLSYDVNCFLIQNVYVKQNAFLSQSFCLENNEYIKDDDCQKYGYFDNNICQLCCNLACGLNGTLVGDNCKNKESNCILKKKYYWIDQVDFGKGDDIYYNLLFPINIIFHFDYSYGSCFFQSREDLLINFAEQIKGKFNYSLGGGHNHFDERLMESL